MNNLIPLWQHSVLCNGVPFSLLGTNGGFVFLHAMQVSRTGDTAELPVPMYMVPCTYIFSEAVFCLCMMTRKEENSMSDAEMPGKK